jgi:hypothetical protein
MNGTIASAVTPAEAVPSIAGHVPVDVLEAYRHLFEHMPTSLLFDRTLFVHGGIPRDETLADRYHDLIGKILSAFLDEESSGWPPQRWHVARTFVVTRNLPT